MKRILLAIMIMCAVAYGECYHSECYPKKITKENIIEELQEGSLAYTKFGINLLVDRADRDGFQEYKQEVESKIKKADAMLQNFQKNSVVSSIVANNEASRRLFKDISDWLSRIKDSYKGELKAHQNELKKHQEVQKEIKKIEAMNPQQLKNYVVEHSVCSIEAIQEEVAEIQGIMIDQNVDIDEAQRIFNDNYDYGRNGGGCGGLYGMEHRSEIISNANKGLYTEYFGNPTGLNLGREMHLEGVSEYGADPALYDIISLLAFLEGKKQNSHRASLYLRALKSRQLENYERSIVNGCEIEYAEFCRKEYIVWVKKPSCEEDNKRLLAIQQSYNKAYKFDENKLQQNNKFYGCPTFNEKSLRRHIEQNFKNIQQTLEEMEIIRQWVENLKE